MTEIMSIGTALVDIFVHSPQFQVSRVAGEVMLCQQYGEKTEVDSFHILSGGGATNTSVSLARLGYETAVLAEMGKDSLAKMILEDLLREEVDTRFLIRERKEQTGGSVIMIGNDGQRTVMVHRGAASMLDVQDLPREELVKTRWWHLSSIAGRLPVLHSLFTLARLHQIGVSWNPGKAELQLLANHQLQPQEICCKLLFMNNEEWGLIKDQQTALQSLIPQIIVTNGARGGKILIRDSADIVFQAQNVKSVDATGAGDAFASAYVAAYLHKKHPIEAAQWGVANAGSVVQAIGAKPGLLTMAQLEKVVKF